MKKYLYIMIVLLFSCSNEGRTKAVVGMCFRDNAAQRNVVKIVEIIPTHGSISVKWLRNNDRDFSNSNIIFEMPLNHDGYYKVDCLK
jgi:hypothetical protein